MRYFTFLVVCGYLLLGMVQPGHAQDGRRSVSRQLTWQGAAEVVGPDSKLHRIPSFAGMQPRRGMLQAYTVVSVPGTVAEGQVQKAVYEPFSAPDAALLKNFKDAGPTPAPFVGSEQGQPVTLVLLPTIRRSAQSGQPEKLVSFEYSYTLAPPVVRRGQGISYAPNSVLRSGTWYKVGVDRSGIFKLDRAALTTMGLDVQNLDPSRLQVYGNATGLLPQAISTRRPDDLVENAVYFSGDANSTLDANEYFLFYARGPHVWEPDPTAGAQRFRHIQNVYSDTAYYFVTVAPAPRTGRRVAAAPGAGAANAPAVTQYAARWFWERELVNLAKSGRQWLGEGFNAGVQQTFDSDLTDLVAGTPVQVTASLAGRSINSQSFTISASGTTIVQSVPNVTPPSPGLPYYPEYAATSLQTRSVAATASSSPLRLGLTFNCADATATGYLDYLEVNARRPLRLAGSFLEFRSFENVRAGSITPFTLAGSSGTTQVWDVTNPRRPRAYALNGAGTFVAPTDSLREFVAFDPAGSFSTPRSFGRVGNQNLHGTLNPARDLDMVIVTYPAFRAQAQELADWRRTNDGLKVAVVTTTQVYNEFGGGSQDVSAIRDMMKMVYDQRDSPRRNQYLLLFGDASYDYKSKPSNLNNTANLPAWWTSRVPGSGDRIAQNYVPTYESRESFAQILPRVNSFGDQTFCSDDYFGMLDDNEGEWEETYGANGIMDVAVGRLPVRTPVGEPNSTAQAAAVVKKLKDYDLRPSLGKWRNRLTFVADDQDGSTYPRDYAEPLISQISRQHPAFNFRKVYLDMYPQFNASANGERSPECERAVDESFEQGSLVINYNGHGGPEALTDEKILTRESVLRLQNLSRQTFMVTGTCDFSYYDNPERTSAGELTLTDVEGGAMGLFTTTRLVYGSTLLITPLLDSVLSVRSGQATRIGDAARYSKFIGSNDPLNRNYVLLGDPSTRLARPDVSMTLDSINGVALTPTYNEPLTALSTVRLSGSVRNTAATTSSINANFSGTAQVTVYEKPSTITTLASSPLDIPLPIQVQENIIYDGQATITNGRFTVQFVVPRDINYSLGLGKVSLYASNRSGAIVDAHGYRSVPVGGASTTAATDTIPPRIRLFMDNEKFVFGGLTGNTTTLIARLFDESGINTTGSGIGHEITATLDNDPTNLTILNSFYVASVDSFQSGRVEYLFKDLATGPHVLHLKAWDTYNNSAIRDVEFIAASTDKLALKHVLNYPNPFSTTTTFHFDHNRSEDALDVQVQIFTVSGRLVRTLQTTVAGGASHVPANYSDSALSWNGRDEFNDQLARGVYVYRVSVRSQKDQATATKFEKLVILN